MEISQTKSRENSWLWSVYVGWLKTHGTSPLFIEFPALTLNCVMLIEMMMHFYTLFAETFSSDSWETLNQWAQIKLQVTKKKSNISQTKFWPILQNKITALIRGECGGTWDQAL